LANRLLDLGQFNVPHRPSMPDALKEPNNVIGEQALASMAASGPG
jgi:hypothetical protein